MNPQMFQQMMQTFPAMAMMGMQPQQQPVKQAQPIMQPAFNPQM